MPPKRDAAQLRALADDPAVGWLQTPVASRTAVGLPGDYLSAFLKHHDMPVTRHQLNLASGPRLWQSKGGLIPPEQRDVSIIFPEGIEALVRAFDHGFAAPVAVQDKFLTFLRALPADKYGLVAERLEHHYHLCRAFRVGAEELGSPPSYLDLYKDDRVPKMWRADCTFPSVLINANELLRTWPGLMGSTWNSQNAPRDAMGVWASSRADVETLHGDIDGESSTLSEEEKARARCFSIVIDGVLWLNYISFIVFVNNLPGPLARTLNLRSSFFDAFTDIGSHSAKVFLGRKLMRAHSDLAASHLRCETDGSAEQIRPIRNSPSLPLARRLAEMPPHRTAEEEVLQSPPALPSLATLPEVCLDWVKDLGVSRQDLSGVKSQFKALVHIEVSSGQLPPKSPTEAWSKTPPIRFRDLAEGAVASYRSMLERRYVTIPVGGTPKKVGTKRKRSDGQSSEESSDEDDDILKVSEIMRVAGVWKAVWSSFRSDLANQMLSLKCSETQGSFSARRPETVRGHIPVLVHKYRKSTDWPLAWTALKNTRDLYEKRIREFLQDMFLLASHPSATSDPTSAQLARDLAATLRVSASSEV